MQLRINFTVQTYDNKHEEFNSGDFFALAKTKIYSEAANYTRKLKEKSSES